MTIRRWILVNESDVEDSFEFDSYTDAVQEARRRLAAAEEPWAVIEREYEYADSSLVWTPDDSFVWPPNGGLDGPT